MTNTLGLARQEAADALTAAGITASEFIPGRITPPVAIISAGSPYLEKGLTFTDTLVRLEVTLVAGQSTNAVVTEALDDLICKTVLALNGWDLESVSQPFQLEANGALYLASTAVYTAYINIEEVI